MKRKYSEVESATFSPSSDYDSQVEEEFVPPTYDEARDLVLLTAKLPTAYIQNVYYALQILEGRKLNPDKPIFDMDMMKINIATYRMVRSYVDSCDYLYAVKNRSIDLDMYAYTGKSVTDKKLKVIDRINKIHNLVIAHKRMAKIKIKKRVAESLSTYQGGD